MTARPLVVTAGEPAGIGPDLCVMIGAMGGLNNCLIVGDDAVLRDRAATLGVDFALDVIDTPFPTRVTPGQPDPANAKTLLDGLRTAVEGCRSGQFKAMVTAPLAKHVINDAGVAFTGHTEFLAELTGADLPVMLLVANDLRVALATTHMPLRKVPDQLNQTDLRQILGILHADLQSRFNIASPEIIVCGLNPHAGEGGHLGHEDDAIIAPVVNDCAAAGINVRGPMPADTAFTPAAGHHDAILAMYHDQGLPALKQAGFGYAVNVTLGIPIVRTSVDHGTAFDIAGTGRADTGSLLAAIELARKLQHPA